MPRALLQGSFTEPLASLLADVLGEGGIRLERNGEPTSAQAPAVILVEATLPYMEQRMLAARAAAAGSPIIAILPIDDERLGQRALSCGASAWHSLDTPLERFHALVSRLLAGRT